MGSPVQEEQHHSGGSPAESCWDDYKAEAH